MLNLGRITLWGHRSIRVIVALVSALSFLIAVPASALFQTPFFTEVSECLVNAAGGSSASGKVYVIGDSIANGTKGELEQALTGKGFSEVVINATDSRRLSEGTDDLDGLGVLASDSAAYKDADTIIIELGTNNGLDADNIAKAVKTVKENAANAKLYWVNIGANNDLRNEADIDVEALDRVLRENAGADYSVVDWKRAVNQNPNYISDDGFGVHPFTTDGRPAFAQTVADGVAVISGAASANPDCACAGGSKLDGSDNKQRIWNFFIGKGLEPFQVAGILGNMQAESHFEPRLVQYGQNNSRGEVSVPDQPSSLDDNVPPGALTGYGIVQWTPATKILEGLNAYNTENNTTVGPGDLEFQVNLLWSQLEGTGIGAYISEKAAGDDLKSTIDVDGATKSFLHKYERAGAPNDDERIGFAKQILSELGSGTNTATGDPCGGARGPTGGTLSWPEEPASNISQCYTWNGSGGHPGMDIYSGQGKPIFAAAAGVVTHAGAVTGYGPNFVAIKHDNGLGTSYGHMSSKSVNVGDIVVQGQQIGEEGNEGYSFGSHLHFNVFPGEYSGGDTPNVNPLENGLSIPPEVNNQAGCQ